MAIDSLHGIGVVSTRRYRSESLALALAKEAQYQAIALTYSDVDGIPPRLPLILIEVDSKIEAALAATRHIIARHPETKVVLVGLIESEEAVVHAAEAGASGYISPAAPFQELVRTLDSVARGEFVCKPAAAYTLFSHLTDLATIDSAIVSQGTVLSARECQIVELMSHSLSNREIAERLFLSTHTVKNHVHRILKKLQMPRRTHVIRYCQLELQDRRSPAESNHA